MLWLAVAIGVVILALLVVIVRAAVLRGRRASDDQPRYDVDPLFSTGIVFVGAGVALAVTLGPVMYAVMAAGLILMAIGANRTRHRPNHH
jgi:hypothetical protein